MNQTVSISKDIPGAGLRRDDPSAWFLDQAMAFEKSTTESERASSKRAWRITWCALSLAGVAIVAGAVLAYVNKPPPPVVMTIAEGSGELRLLNSLSDGQISYGKATDLYNLRRYVETRESYDWETIQDLYNVVRQMSGPREAGLYGAFHSTANPQAPVNVLKNRFRVIATAGTVSFVGATALVSYSRKTIPLDGSRPRTEYFVATVTHQYVNEAVTDTERGLNPSGFKATSYQSTADITKTQADAEIDHQGASQ